MKDDRNFVTVGDKHYAFWTQDPGKGFNKKLGDGCSNLVLKDVKFN